MTPVQSEIKALEEQLRLAELGPDSNFFDHVLADDAVIVSEGRTEFAKSKIVDAHRPGKRPKFTRVDMSDITILDHGTAAVVTCKGVYLTAESTFTLKVVRVWVRKKAGWQIVAGVVSNG
jgi:uncharacterized protein DUF4440